MVKIYSFLSPRLSAKQENLLSDKLFDLANYFAVGFIISQVASKNPSISIVFGGAALYFALGIISLRLLK